MIILEDTIILLKKVLAEKVGKLLFVTLLPFVTWFSFALVYSYNSTEISYINPYNKKNLYPALQRFFKSVCLPGVFGASVIVHPQGCSYIYPGEGLPTTYGKNKIGYWTREVHFEYKGYQDQKLELKYKILYKWPEGSPRLPEEIGVVYFDLSNYNTIGQRLLLQVNPFVAYENHLVQKIEEREPMNPKDMLANEFPSWGVILTGQLQV